MTKTNELIEKAIARARVKTQTRTGAGVVVRTRDADEGKDEKADVRQKRIDGAGGRVVVRRRSRGDAQGSDLADAGYAGGDDLEPEVALAEEPRRSSAVVEETPVQPAPVEVRAVEAPPTPAVSAPTPAPLPAAEPAAEVVRAAPTPEAPATAAPAPVVEPPPRPREVTPQREATPAREATGQREAPAPREAGGHRDAAHRDAPHREASPREGAARDNVPREGAARDNAPREGAPRDAAAREAAEAERRAAATVRRPRPTESARVIYRPPTQAQNPPQPQRQGRGSESDPLVVYKGGEDNSPRDGAEDNEPRSRRRVEVPRSLEDVLAEERGFVPSLHRAVVVAPPPTEAPAPRPRPAAPPAGASSATPQGGARPLPSAASPGSHLSPTAHKELMAEETKRGGLGLKTERVPGGRRRSKRERGASKRGGMEGDFSPAMRRRKAAGRKVGKKTVLTTPKAAKRVVLMEDVISVGDLAHQMSIKSAQVIKKLMTMGVMATVNQMLDMDTASLIAQEFEYEVRNTAFDEADFIPDIEDEDENLEPRAPVVTIMGHVDHGKTTLLDKIRSTDVAAGEAGGITQHIGAYKVHTERGTVVFLDTPGHEAFTAMRARGAEVTDIVILVVAADDGVMPQTLEAIKHAKEADVPIIVAVNKIDKPGANPDAVMRMLAEKELVPEDWGGDTIYAQVSAKQGIGISELLELILLQAEVLELRANPNRPARTAVIEAQLDKGRGPVATVLVQTGTLKVGDFVVAGAHYGKVRAMHDEHGKSLETAGPSTPVQILGLSGVPDAGEELAVVEDLDTARDIAEERGRRLRTKSLSETAKVSMEDLMRQLKEEEPEEVRLVVKADVQGSLEALCKSFVDLSTSKVRVNIIASGVGAINESDVSLAKTSGALVMGFNVQPDNNASNLAEQDDVKIHTSSIIYEALDELRRAMTSRLAPIIREKVTGHAEVRDLFTIPKVGVIAGCMVLDGKIQRNSMARLSRAGKQLWEGKLSSLKRFKDDVREVEKGYECGIGLESYTELLAGDIIEAYMNEEIAPTL